MAGEHIWSDDQPSIWDSSREKLHRNMSANMWIEWITSLSDAVEKELGEEGKKLYDEVMYEVGRECAWDILHYFGRKARMEWGEPLTAAITWHMMDWLFAYKDEVIVREKDMAVVRVNFCPNVFRPQGSVCRLNSFEECMKTKMFRKGLIDGVNPFMAAIPVKAMSNGDEVCEWLIVPRSSMHLKEYIEKKKEWELYPEIARIYKDKIQSHDHDKKCYPRDSGSIGGIMIREDITWDSSDLVRWRSLLATLGIGIFRRHEEKLRERFGAKGKDIFDRVAYQVGRNMALDYMKYIGEDTRNEWGEVLTTAMVTHWVDFVCGFYDEIVVREKDMVVVRLHECPWCGRALGSKSRHHTKMDCAKLRQIDWGFIESVNPGLAFIPVKRMVWQDHPKLGLLPAANTCEWLICKKESEAWKRYLTEAGEGADYPALYEYYKDKEQPHDHYPKCYPIRERTKTPEQARKDLDVYEEMRRDDEEILRKGIAMK